MLTARLLVVILVVEAALLAGQAAILAGHAFWSARRQRRDTAMADHARRLVRGAVLGGPTPAAAAAAVAALRALPVRVALPLLLDLTAAVSGDVLTRLRGVAAEAGLTGRARSWCRSRRWWRRLRGLRLLARLGGAHDLVPVLLHDPHPAVRAAAADAAADAPDDAVVGWLLRTLDDPDPLCRFSAKAALLRTGSAATGSLCRYLDDPGAARAADALQVAAALADAAFLPAALALSGHADPDIRRRAADLLARLGGEPAALRLADLTGDPDSRVRAAAATGIGTLGHWPASPALATALADPSWDVRSAAAISLRRMGPAGRIYLRHAVAGPERFAADISRQVLDLPDGAVHVVTG